ncbi:MAG: hypothetical protein ACUVQ9_11155 [Thermodesulfobacteriota bacterium]
MIPFHGKVPLITFIAHQSSSICESPTAMGLNYTFNFIDLGQGTPSEFV